jgi:hypothetical protein
MKREPCTSLAPVQVSCNIQTDPILEPESPSPYFPDRFSVSPTPWSLLLFNHVHLLSDMDYIKTSRNFTFDILAQHLDITSLVNSLYHHEFERNRLYR